MSNVVPADRTAAAKAGDFGKGLGYNTTVSDDSAPVDFTARADIAAAEVDGDSVATHAAAKLAAAVHSFKGVKVAVINGGAAGNLTVTGIATADQLAGVLVFTTAASIATLADLTSEFTITAADTINNTGGTSTANNRVLVIYTDLT